MELLTEAIDEGKKGAGAQSFDGMVASVGLRGGSVVKLKRRPLEHGSATPKKADGGEKSGKGKGKGSSRGGTAAPPKGEKSTGAAVKATKPNTKAKEFELEAGVVMPSSKTKKK